MNPHIVRDCMMTALAIFDPKSVALGQFMLQHRSPRSALAAEIKDGPAPAPRLHPRLADLYRDKVERLQDSLNADATRDDAAEALRAPTEEIRLVPENGRLEIELAGDVAGIRAQEARHGGP